MRHGEASEWSAAPRPAGVTEAKAFDHFSSSGSEDETEDCEDCAVKSVGGRYSTRHRNGSKWRTSCWTDGLDALTFFVRLLTIHMQTEFPKCMCMY